MQMDLRTISITPIRQTFGHLARRMGADKPASRYMEATMDLQAVENFHYRPTWDPQHEIFDPSRTAIRMKDWYALKDPRQYYYGTWTLARGRMQETAEADFDMAEELALPLAWDSAAREAALPVLLPLRHLAWGANINDSFIAAYGMGTALTQAACYASMDQLGIAQYVTRLALAFDELELLARAKQDWLQDAAWQELRRLVEDLMVEKDWYQVLVAQDFVLNGLLYPLIYQRYMEQLAAAHGPLLSMLTRFQREWYVENVKWIDAVLKATAAESAENKALLAQWVAQWRERARRALAPVAALAFGAEAEGMLDEVQQGLDARVAKCGISITS